MSQTESKQLTPPQASSRNSHSKGRASLVWLLCFSAVLLLGSAAGEQNASKLTAGQPDLSAMTAQNRPAQHFWQELHLTNMHLAGFKDPDLLKTLNTCSLPFQLYYKNPASNCALPIAANHGSMLQHCWTAECICCHVNAPSCSLVRSHNDSDAALHSVLCTFHLQPDVPDMSSFQVHRSQRPPCKNLEMRPQEYRGPARPDSAGSSADPRPLDDSTPKRLDCVRGTEYGALIRASHEPHAQCACASSPILICRTCEDQCQHQHQICCKSMNTLQPAPHLLFAATSSQSSSLQLVMSPFWRPMQSSQTHCS